MIDFIEDEYYSVGGNRHSAVADWSPVSGFLAFGADRNVAIWSPLDQSRHGISTVLRGHVDKVTSVKFLSSPQDDTKRYLISGSADGSITLWREPNETGVWTCEGTSTAQSGTVNVIATLNGSNFFVTGGADSKLKLWKADKDGIHALAEMQPKPRYIPLAMALCPLSADDPPDAAILAVGGTRNDVQVYAIDQLSSTPSFSLCATLPGHEGWLRSLSITTDADGSYLLASASQDKYIRIWRLRDAESSHPLGTSRTTNGVSTGKSSLTAKVQSVFTANYKYSITFEALLLGHEDWVYSAAWNPQSSVPQLLTASADGSLSIWEPDQASGIWISISRLGEISSQKGATTATGSSGGFWIGLWSPRGDYVTCLGRTGSWRLWKYNQDSDFWSQTYAVGGHIGSVNGICWATDGSYLLSTSSDQTTRLHAEWSRDDQQSWHEFSRPQIHGYDLNCITSITPHQFVSGADEKLLRVFNEPRDIATMLHRLCGISLPAEDEQLPDTAAIPVLGLSNKATNDDEAFGEENPIDEASNDRGHVYSSSMFDIDEPPSEDLLARHTLWPEHEKLYGHGYEISEAASSVDGDILATACKASSVDNAVIRLYDTRSWNEIKPPLAAHSLTVTRLALSSTTPRYILSVGRDRQWTVFEESDGASKGWSLAASNAKAHTRMILDCAWLPQTAKPTFVTAGRDKMIKVWRAGSTTGEFQVSCVLEIKRKSAVTSVATFSNPSQSVIAAGEDDGTISIHVIGNADEAIQVTSFDVEARFCPSSTVNRLAWRPSIDGRPSNQLAVASADGSVRILRVDLGKIIPH